MTSRVPPTSRAAQACSLLIALLVALAWAYWPALSFVVSSWSDDPQYTHGYVAPIFAAVVLWFRRDSFPADRVGPSWLGLPLLFVAALMYLAGAMFAWKWLETGSLLPALAGVVILSLGAAVARWAWPVAAFLVFILPWPWQLDQLLTHPLRQVATVSSTYLLQTLGVPALARGHVIVISEQEIKVVGECSGLGMLMTFFALSTAVALVMSRPWVDRVVVFASAVPVGVLMNVLRITVTVWLFQVADSETAKFVFHDLAGWVMMPAALLVMWLEMLFLSRLWRPQEEAERTAPVPVPVAVVSTPATPPRWAARRTPERVPRPEPAEKRSLQEIPDVAP